MLSRQIEDEIEVSHEAHVWVVDGLGLGDWLPFRLEWRRIVRLLSLRNLFIRLLVERSFALSELGWRWRGSLAVGLVLGGSIIERVTSSSMGLRRLLLVVCRLLGRRLLVSQLGFHYFTLLVFQPRIMLELALIVVLLFLEVTPNFLKLLLLHNLFYLSPHCAQFLKLVHLEAVEL